MDQEALYQEALKNFGSVMHLTYFEFSEHTTITDLCYLCLHELDLHAEGEYWHPIKERRALLKFCQKWGAYATEDRINYVTESQRQFDIGLPLKKVDAYI
jgi:hypothetical protein